MVNFPTLPGVRRNIERGLTKPEIKSKFEGNYAQTRPIFTRATYDFRIEYAALTIAQVEVLEQFFVDNKGGSFNWINPQDGKTYVVRFAEDKLSPKQITKELYTISIAFEEE